MNATYTMNKHPMMTRSKSKNNLIQQSVEKTDYIKNIKKKIESLISDILNYDISQPAFVPVLVIIMAFTVQTLIVFIKKLFNVFDYISELETQYFGVKSEDDQIKHVYICIAMNIIAWMLFFRSTKNEQEVQFNYYNAVDDNAVDDNAVDDNDAVDDNAINDNDAVDDNAINDDAVDDNEDVEPLQHSCNPDYIVNEYNESDMTDDQIAEIKELANRFKMTDAQSYQFMHSCHNCEKKVGFGELYCCPRCQDYIEAFNYNCFRVKDGFCCRYCWK